MQVEAIYDQGKLEFVTNLKLKHDRLRLLVTVPDEEIVTIDNPFNLPDEVVEYARSMRHKLDAIRNSSLPLDEELPELTEKQKDRMAAYETREDR